MSEGHVTEGAPKRNPKTIIEIVQAAGGAFIPYEGTYCAISWGEFLKISPKAFRLQVSEYGIPHMLSGKKMMVDAVDYRNFIPRRGSVDLEE